MKTSNVNLREEWILLGISGGFGIGALAIPVFVPFGTSSSLPIFAFLGPPSCGILALVFLGFHMSSRFRRKTAERKKAKNGMAEILESIREEQSRSNALQRTPPRGRL